jgi:hypothetical protein
MTTDPTLTLLRGADPLAGLRAADPDLDPRGAMAARVHAGATARRDAPIRRGGGARRAVAGLAATAALAAVALAVGLSGGPTAPADARAALVSAAQRTAAFTSGRLTWHLTSADPASGYDVAATNVLRYEGADLDIDTTTVEHGVGGDPAAQEHAGGYRLVGGQAFQRTGDGALTPVPAPRDGATGGAGRFHDELLAADALLDAARGAPDVTQSKDGDTTRFTATLAGAAVPDAFGPSWKTRGAPATLTATVGADGAVRTIALRSPTQTTDVAFDDLGRPQGITAP